MKMMKVLSLSLLLIVGNTSSSASAFQVQRDPLSSRQLSARALLPRSVVVSSTRLRAALLSIDENASRDVPTMEQWASASGIQRHPGLELFHDTSCLLENPNDWSCRANQPIASGQPIVMVPREILWDTQAIKAEFGGALSGAIDSLSKNGVSPEDIPKFYLLVKLLQHVGAGEQSPYFPWLNSLPRIYFNAASMTPFCLECLPPLIYRYAREKQVLLENFSRALQKIDFLDKSIESRAMGLWAFNVVSTRSFSVDGTETDKFIAPLADYFNHGTYPNAAYGKDEQGNVVVYATQDIQPGEPIQVSYGDPTNPSRLFAVYGFLDESSPATFCKITHIQPNDELRNLGLDFSRMLFYKETGEVSTEVWDVLLYDILGKINKNDQQVFYQAHMEGDGELKNQIHQYYFAQTSTALKKHVDDFLKNLEALSNKSVGKDFAEHPRLPLILKHNQFVAQTFLNVKARLDPMVEQALQQQLQQAESAASVA